jgi:hypothetical protein
MPPYRARAGQRRNPPVAPFTVGQGCGPRHVLGRGAGRLPRACQAQSLDATRRKSLCPTSAFSGEQIRRVVSISSRQVHRVRTRWRSQLSERSRVMANNGDYASNPDTSPDDRTVGREGTASGGINWEPLVPSAGLGGRPRRLAGCGGRSPHVGPPRFSRDPRTSHTCWPGPGVVHRRGVADARAAGAARGPDGVAGLLHLVQAETRTERAADSSSARGTSSPPPRASGARGD